MRNVWLQSITQADNFLQVLQDRLYLRIKDVIIGPGESLAGERWRKALTWLTILFLKGYPLFLEDLPKGGKLSFL